MGLPMGRLPNAALRASQRGGSKGRVLLDGGVRPAPPLGLSLGDTLGRVDKEIEFGVKRSLKEVIVDTLDAIEILII